MRLALVFVATAALAIGTAGAVQSPPAGAAGEAVPNKTAMVVYLDAEGDVLGVRDHLKQKPVEPKHLKEGALKNVDVLYLDSHQVIIIIEKGKQRFCFKAKNCDLYCI
jgi:hypothetical protein